MKNHGRVIGSSPYRGISSPVDRLPFAAAGANRTNLASTAYSAAGRVRRDALDVPEPTRRVAYACPAGHDLVLAFHAGAAVPQVWECAVHRQDARLSGREDLEGAGAIVAEILEVSSRHSPKTHLEHVRERRTEAELEEILQEQLMALRERCRAATAETAA